MGLDSDYFQRRKLDSARIEEVDLKSNSYLRPDRLKMQQYLWKKDFAKRRDMGNEETFDPMVVASRYENI
jgi:hypothetical protein